LVLIDTNVLAFLVLEGPQTAAARALLGKDDDWRSESYVLIELTNVLTTTMRVRGLSMKTAQKAFSAAREAIEPGLVSIRHEDAITYAHRYDVTAYDARFLVTAHKLGIKLATEDTKLRRAAPKLTQSITDALTRLPNDPADIL
jgi:predicted nucleic acid-binding protein